MIAGIGTDILKIDRLKASYARTQGRLAERILGAEEIKVFHARLARNESRGMAYLATRFAAKEALTKALNLKTLNWRELEVLNEESGKPYFAFHGDMANFLKGKTVHLTLSHDAGIASAMVIVEAK